MMTETEICNWRRKELDRLDCLISQEARTECLAVINVLSGVLGDIEEEPQL